MTRLRNDNPANDYSDAETARRRDEVIRRMANTPPQHRVTRPPKKAKATARGQKPLKRGVRPSKS